MNHLNFKGKQYTQKQIKNNILKIWDLCDELEKYNWYMEALGYALELTHEWSGGLRSSDVSKTCGVIAALSPLKLWEDTKKLTYQFLMEGKRDGHIRSLINKAVDIMNSSGSQLVVANILKGDKTTSFYKNVLNPNQVEAITIDRHSLSVALGRKVPGHQLNIMPDQYQFIVGCYKELAAEIKVSPLTLQSATWLKWRKIHTVNLKEQSQL